MSTALVLAGAVAKGAFEAGVIAELTARKIDVNVIVATSAGSLNAALLATGLCHGNAELAAEKLIGLWKHQATWTSIVRPTLRGLFEHTGLSSSDALREILLGGMEAVAREAAGDAHGSVSLNLVATSLAGETRTEHGIPSTTFEHVATFREDAFETREGRESVAQAALASSAFPLLFTPVNLPGAGASIDGGAVNNTPISWALAAGAERVIVVTGNPLQAPAEPELRGAELIGKEIDITINERLFRDLRQARRVNQKLDALTRVLNELPLDDAGRARVLGTLGWKPLEVVEVRPPEPLRGSAFSALSDAGLRDEYIRIGRDAARRAL